MTKAGSPPAGSRRRVSAGLLLTPGAGADRNQPALVAIEGALRPRGVEVERMDFPYRKAGRRSPDREPVLVQAIREGAEPMRRRLGFLALGGRSMGGRMCSVAVAHGLAADALVLVSYPLHPPGRPDRLRVEHFPAIGVPCLFVSGTRDAFARVDELEAATASIPGPVTHRWIDGGDHGLRGRDDAVATVVTDWLMSLAPSRADEE